MRMIIDRELIEEYPFDGEFYEVSVVDASLPPSQREKREVVLLSTKCDIQEAQKSDKEGATHVRYNVYFPFDKDAGVTLKRGISFRGSMYGVNIDGKVVSIAPTQLGGCACYIEDDSQ